MNRPFLEAIAQRRRYALVLGAAFWVLMSAHVVREGGRWARGGLPLGWDFHVFHAAGRIVAEGLAPRLYDERVLNAVAKATVPGDYPVFVYLNPPHFAFAFSGLAGLSHPVAFGVFSAFNLAALSLALRLVSVCSVRSLAYALSGYPVVVGFFAGQNCFLSLLLMAVASALALRGRAFAAGCAVGALVYKPQLAVGFLVLFLLDGKLRCRAIAGFALVAAAFVGLNLAVSLEASRAYLEMIPSLPERHAQFRLALAFTARAFFELLLPRSYGVAAALGALTSVASVASYALFARRERDLAVRLAGAAWLSLAVTPHAYVYEWTLLLLTLALLRGKIADGAWVAIAAALLVVSYVSAPIAEAMVEMLGFGVQLAVPVFFAAAWYAAAELRSHPEAPSTA